VVLVAGAEEHAVRGDALGRGEGRRRESVRARGREGRASGWEGGREGRRDQRVPLSARGFKFASTTTSRPKSSSSVWYLTSPETMVRGPSASLRNAKGGRQREEGEKGTMREDSQEGARVGCNRRS
jgi:hypothetical protein